MEAKLREDWNNTVIDEKSAFPPQLIIDHFSFEELHAVMLRNESKLLGMFDELSCCYGQLDLYMCMITRHYYLIIMLLGFYY